MNEAKEDGEAERIKKKMTKELMEDQTTSDFPDDPIKVTDDDFQDTIQNYPLVLVDFWAGWCGPCKMMEPVLEELAQEYQGDLVIAKMNVDENSRIPGQFQVSSIPTMVLFKDGEQVERMMGALPKEQLKQKIEQYTT